MTTLTGNEELNQITQKVIGCLYTVSNALGGRFLERVYQNAAAIEIAKTGLVVHQQYPIPVKYDRIIPHISWKSSSM